MDYLLCVATPSFSIDLLSSCYVPGTGHMKTERLSESLAWESQKNKAAKLQQSETPECSSKQNKDGMISCVWEDTGAHLPREWCSQAFSRLSRKVSGGKMVFEAQRLIGKMSSFGTGTDTPKYGPWISCHGNFWELASLQIQSLWPTQSYCIRISIAIVLPGDGNASKSLRN